MTIGQKSHFIFPCQHDRTFSRPGVWATTLKKLIKLLKQKIVIKTIPSADFPDSSADPTQCKVTTIGEHIANNCDEHRTPEIKRHPWGH